MSPEKFRSLVRELVEHYRIVPRSFDETIDRLVAERSTKKRAMTPDAVSYTHLDVYKRQAHYVGSNQVRRKGTMVGSICNASPTGDCGSILLAMKAQVKIVGPEGERTVGMDDFWTGFKKIAPDKLKGELVTEIFIPELKSGEGSAYFKHSVRKAMDLAIVGVAAWVRLEGKTVADCRIAVAGGDVTIVRAKAAEQMIIGRELTDELVLSLIHI